MTSAARKTSGREGSTATDSWLDDTDKNFGPNLSLLFKMHEIWSIDSQEISKYCCHRMSDFKAHINAVNSISAGLRTDTQPCTDKTKKSLEFIHLSELYIGLYSHYHIKPRFLKT